MARLSKLGDTIVLGTILGTAIGLVEASCSTIEEPSEEEPPVCENCNVGNQTLKCNIAVYSFDPPALWSYIGESAYVCVEPDATTMEQDAACMASCEQFMDDHPSMYERYCDYSDESEPYFFTGCVPPEDTASSQSHTCPSWYSPTTRVSGYQATSASATVTIDRDFLLNIRSDMFSLYVCDTTRYVESTSDWTFDDVASGDLLYELGVRTGDQNANVQGFDPKTNQTTTSSYSLDSFERIDRAYEALRSDDGVKLTVERSGAPGGVFVVWITID